MCREVEVRKNWIISHKFNTDSNFQQQINIDFTPDDMIVKYSQYLNDTSEDDISLVYCDLINDNITTIVDADVMFTPNTIWKMNKAVKGTYKFNIIDEDGAPDTSRQGFLVMNLEFVKYK